MIILKYLKNICNLIGGKEQIITLDTTQKMKFFSKSAVTKSTFTDKILNGNFVFCAVRESE